MNKEVSEKRVPLAINQYTCHTFWKREAGVVPGLETCIELAVAAGVDGFEPSVDSVEDVEQIGTALLRGGLAMRSLYVNSTLHLAQEAEDSLREIRLIAEAARRFGTEIVVTNPNPVRWGGQEDKTDFELRTQAEALNDLGADLREVGVTLAYHNHNSELRCAARELHHMLTGTNPDLVTFCLDPHWVYRGSGNSSVALFDIVTLYGARISELHLRQSVGGIWSETFAEGDIDYARLAERLKALGIQPHLVLEQAVETGSPHDLSIVEAQIRSTEFARRLF